MIYLVTGQPGAGKTLYALTWIQATFPERQIFFSGIADLKLPWTELVEPREWFKTPANSVIVIDECQKIFRPRTLGATTPEYVSALETHRHAGFDLVFITQDPMLVDVNIRRLVGTHYHVVRTFGMHRATVHEWAGTKEQAGKAGYRSDSIKHIFNYPAANFALYKSAEVHTHKRKIPARIWILIFAPIIIIGMIYSVYKWTRSYGEKKPAELGTLSKVPELTPPLPPAKQGVKDSAVTVQEYVTLRQARLVGLPQSAPIYDNLTAPVVAPFPAACVSFKKKCRCYTQQGTPIADNADLCNRIVSEGYFIDFNTVDPNAEKDKLKPASSSASKPAEPVQINLGLPEVPMADASRTTQPVFARGVAAAPKMPQAPRMPTQGGPQ